jgi:pyruvate dehydrogenase E2 component (dihydrolipoamide acetyltransferase)
MALEVRLPEIGENIDSGQIVKLLTKVGDVVARDQALLELETGKASVEVPSPAPGRVISVLVEEGTTVKVGQVLLTLEESRAEGAAEAAPAREKPPPESPALRTQPPAQLAQEAPAPPVPRPPPGQVAPPAAAEPAVPQLAAPAPSAARAVAAPHVRQFAREIGVDLGAVQGSGPAGRISVEDVKRHARESAAAGPGEGLAPMAAAPLPDFSRYGPVERESFTAVRQATAQQMQGAWSTVPHVMLEAEADATELEAFRQKYRARAESQGGKLTVTAILVKAAASALREFPRFNASPDFARKEYVLKKYVNVGVAADTPRGLLVPVLREVDKKSVLEIAVELEALAQKARAGKLSLSEMAGGNFTVTNLGGMGVGHFTAVINAPEVAILAVGKAQTRPVYRDGAFEPRLMLPLSLSIDHRVLDGADGARFLARIVEAIEAPFLFW